MNLEKIVFIHEYLVEYFEDKDDPVSPPGIKNPELLDSAVNRPFMSAGGKDAYIGVYNQAAALFHSVINNHCFHNGNKRTALLSTIIFMSERGHWLTIPTDNEMFEFTRRAAAHELSKSRDKELDYIARWLQSNSRRRSNGERTLKLHELRDILSKFGFEIGDCQGRTMPISKNGKVYTAILQKGGKGKADYDKVYIKQLRKKLKLTEYYNIDSFAFYGADGFKDELYKFMSMRANVMRELAKI